MKQAPIETTQGFGHSAEVPELWLPDRMHQAKGAHHTRLTESAFELTQILLAPEIVRLVHLAVDPVHAPRNDRLGLMLGLQILAVPVTPVYGPGVALPGAHPIPVDDLYLPPLEVFGAVVDEAFGIHIADPVVVPPVPAFGRTLELVHLPTLRLAGRRRGIAEPLDADTGDGAQTILEGLRTQQFVGLVEGLAEDNIAEGKVGSTPGIVMERLGEAPDLTQGRQPDGIGLGLRVVLIVHNQHARSLELTRVKDSHLLGSDLRIGAVVSFVALDGQGGGPGSLGFVDDDRYGIVVIFEVIE